MNFTSTDNGKGRDGGFYPALVIFRKNSSRKGIFSYTMFLYIYTYFDTNNLSIQYTKKKYYFYKKFTYKQILCFLLLKKEVKISNILHSYLFH